jgi:hypothetical protein
MSSRSVPITIKTKSHMDGTTSLKWPLFSVNFAIIFDPALFDLGAISFADLTSLEPLMIGIVKETCVGVTELTSILGKQLLSVLTPIICGML